MRRDDLRLEIVVNPARAGMIRGHELWRYHDYCKPRASGDDPEHSDDVGLPRP